MLNDKIKKKSIKKITKNNCGQPRFTSQTHDLGNETWITQ